MDAGVALWLLCMGRIFATKDNSWESIRKRPMPSISYRLRKLGKLERNEVDKGKSRRNVDSWNVSARTDKSLVLKPPSCCQGRNQPEMPRGSVIISPETFQWTEHPQVLDRPILPVNQTANAKCFAMLRCMNKSKVKNTGRSENNNKWDSCALSVSRCRRNVAYRVYWSSSQPGQEHMASSFLTGAPQFLTILRKSWRTFSGMRSHSKERE